MLQIAIHACVKCFICLQTILHMLQWNQWMVDRSLSQGFTSYLVPSLRGAPHLLLSSPFPPFSSLHLAVAVRARQMSVRSRGHRVGATAGAGQIGRRSMHEQAQEAGLAQASRQGLASRHPGASHADINMAVVVNCKRVGWINCSTCVMTIYRHICDI